jgi:cell division protein FtsI (penicillin-binding protein 3)
MQFLPPDLWVSVYDPTDYEIIKGGDIVTTIDVEMQDIVHNELMKGMQLHNAEAATAVIMEVSTGRIKAISNLSRNKSGEIGEFQNFAMAIQSEPGSTFKSASVLALLEDGFAGAETVVDFAYGKKRFYDQWMYDSSNHGISKSTLQEALEKSSNIGVASIMHDVYNKKERQHLFIDRLRQFGLADISGIEIEGEPKPLIKDPRTHQSEWYGTTIPWMSHGYELMITPLQMLNFYNAVANGGKLMRPQLVKEIRKDGKIERVFPPEIKVNRIAKKENIDQLQMMLEGVVDRGTGNSLKSDLYRFAGKTGTTKVNYNREGEMNYNASFVGYWPAAAPKYSMIVVVYGLKGRVYYGNQVSGPIFRRIVDWTYATQNESGVVQADMNTITSGMYSGEIHGFGPDYDEIFGHVDVTYNNPGRWVVGSATEEGYISSEKAKISVQKMPDLEGMGARDAVYVLENLGMQVAVKGYGKVSRQSLRPGDPINGDLITIYLN